ncbi:MAG: 4Fe-4S dicluster domain-containing protein [Deltaproteobacteria bacterium]|nr:4Fe-4S dicluster domain-containing protein [Deltaproteobacteria bacterium]MBW2306532.1 4Fe-4S dicluster domain-containing protein [Deltaproteobacteria bacterium]
MKVIGVHLDRCTGCKTCELYCAVERGSVGKTLFKAVQESPAPQPRVRVEGSNDAPLPFQCRHCLQAPCLNACLTGALVRDPETNMVVVHEDRCIACWTCTMYCPYGVIFPWPQREMALKCDRCAYMESPVCVDVCPANALELVEVNDFDEMFRERRQEISNNLTSGDEKKGLLLLDLVR